MITDETIERVREQADIVEIVGEHVKLKRAGGDFRGPCPFHGGKNPNFSVSPRRNAYHCFKCGASGDAIGFVREHLGMDFAEAVRYVAARAARPSSPSHSCVRNHSAAAASTSHSGSRGSRSWRSRAENVSFTSTPARAAT